MFFSFIPCRYRGLQSFHSSPWDPKENLPIEYAKIFQFENFRRTQKRVLLSAESDNDILVCVIILSIENTYIVFCEFVDLEDVRRNF